MTPEPFADRYRLLERIGEGAAAEVYRAEDTVGKRVVALKLLSAALSRDSALGARLHTSLTVAASLSHANIVEIWDHGAAGGRYFIAMEHLPYPTLETYLAEHGPLPEEECRRLTAQILDALAVAHEAGLIHRNLNPRNVFIVDGARAKVADFGIERPVPEGDRTHPDLQFGFLYYTAPEQALGREIGPRTDLYAVGIMLYEMVSGRRPFRRENPVMLVHQHLEQPPPPLASVAPGVSSTLAAVVERALAKQPEERYADARAMRAALVGLTADAASFPARAATSAPSDRAPARPARAPTAIGRAGGDRGRWGKAAAWVGVPLLLILALAGWALARGGARGGEADTAAPGGNPSSVGAIGPNGGTSESGGTARLVRGQRLYAAPPGREGLNLYSRPSGGAPILLAIPAGGEVRAADAEVTNGDGAQWHRVVYQGRTGFVYRQFLEPNRDAALSRSRSATPGPAITPRP